MGVIKGDTRDLDYSSCTYGAPGAPILRKRKMTTPNGRHQSLTSCFLPSSCSCTGQSDMTYILADKRQ